MTNSKEFPKTISVQEKETLIRSLSRRVCCLIYLHRVELKRNKTQRLFALLCIFIFMENKIPLISR